MCPHPYLASRSRGQRAEELACRHLCDQGLTIVERNYRCPRGEIDLIMNDDGTLVFVEVRYRRNNIYGDGAESVNRSKQERLIATALHYLQTHDRERRPTRFDVVSIAPGNPRERIEWLRDAFQAQ